jgi:hypothetical protein
MLNENDLLNPREAASLLHMAPATLAIWRCRKRYDLAYLKVGRKVLYRRSDLEAFLQSSIQQGSISPRRR